MSALDCEQSANNPARGAADEEFQGWHIHCMQAGMDIQALKTISGGAGTVEAAGLHPASSPLTSPPGSTRSCSCSSLQGAIHAVVASEVAAPPKGTDIGSTEQDNEAMSANASPFVGHPPVPAMQGPESCLRRDSWNNGEPSHCSIFSGQMRIHDEIAELRQSLQQKSSALLQLQSDFCHERAEIEKQRKAAESKNIFCREELREMTERAKSLSEQVRKSKKKVGELHVARQWAEECEARFVREDAACKALKAERDGLQLELQASCTAAQTAIQESVEWREAMTKGALPQQQQNEFRLAAEEANEVMMAKHCDELDDLMRRHNMDKRELQQEVIELRSECTRLKLRSGPVDNLKLHFEDHIAKLKLELVDQLANLHGQQQEQRGQDEKEMDQLRKSHEGCQVALAASQQDFAMLARLFEKERWEHMQLRDSLAELHQEVSSEATQRWTAALTNEHSGDNPSCSSISDRPVETAGSLGSGSIDPQLAVLQAAVSSPCFPNGSDTPGVIAAGMVRATAATSATAAATTTSAHPRAAAAAAAAAAASVAAVAATTTCDPPCEVSSTATGAMELAAMPPAAPAELVAFGAASPSVRDRYLAVPGRMMGAAECSSAADLSASLSSSSASATQIRLHGGASVAYSRRRPSTGLMSTI